MTQKSHRSDKKELETLFDRHYGLLVSQAISFRPPTQADLDDYIQIAKLAAKLGKRVRKKVKVIVKKGSRVPKVIKKGKMSIKGKKK